MRSVTISPEAEREMLAGFRAGLPAAVIAKKVEAVCGQKIASRTIGRRAAAWRAEQRRRQTARETVEDLVVAMRQQNATATEMIGALATQALLDNPEGFSSQDPMMVQRANLRTEELRLKAKAVEIKERQVAVEESKLAILVKREEAARAALDAAATKQISPEELEDRIRDIYGLRRETASGTQMSQL